MTTPLVSVRDLTVGFNVRRGGVVRAVDGVSFDIARGETLGLVGESGCGKTTAGRAILRLTPISAGQVLFDGQDLGTAVHVRPAAHAPDGCNWSSRTRIPA